MARLFQIWERDHPIFRIHPEIYGAAQFNDSGLGDARFSPLVMPDGRIIPTLYGATTFGCAAMETIFHDLPRDIDDFIFDFTALQGAVCSVIAPTRDLKLLPLTSVGLKSLKLEKTDVIETSPDHYRTTRGYALGWHQAFAGIDGLYWTSRLEDRAQACMLFGDRVKPADLGLVAASEPVHARPHIDRLVHLAKELGINQGYAFPSDILNF